MNPGYLFTELLQRRRRSLAVVISIALGVSLFISLQAYGAGYRQAARAPMALIGADIAAQRQGDVPEAFEGPVFPHSTAPIHRDEVEAIRSLPGVESVGEAVLFWDFDPDQFLVVLGLEPTVSIDKAVGPGRLLTAVRDGRFLAQNDHLKAVVDVSFAEENSIKLDDTVLIAGRTFSIVGLVDTSRTGQVANANIYIPLVDAREIAGSAASVLAVHDFQKGDSNILFIKANQAQAENVTEAVEELLGDQSLVSSAQSFGKVLGASFQLIDQFGWVIGLTGLLVAIAGLLRSISSNLRERRRDIALMRAVGWLRISIVKQLTAEAVVLSFAGGIAGLGIASVITFILNQTSVNIPVPWELSPTPHFLSGGALEMGLTIPLPAQIDWITASAALLLAVLCGAGVGIVLAGRAANIKPAEVLQDE
ncbi:MAG: ABC transporter permease [Spirochaetia bacterium]|nr:ABC transporter permease [Spirochaetia bacterium]